MQLKKTVVDQSARIAKIMDSNSFKPRIFLFSVHCSQLHCRVTFIQCLLLTLDFCRLFTGKTEVSFELFHVQMSGT